MHACNFFAKCIVVIYFVFSIYFAHNSLRISKGLIAQHITNKLYRENVSFHEDCLLVLKEKEVFKDTLIYKKKHP